MHNIDLLFCSWKTFDVKFGRYLDPFSISIDIRRSQRSRYGSYFAIDSVRLHNCEPGIFQEITTYVEFSRNMWRSVKFRINLRGHHFSQNSYQKLPRILPYTLINFQGRNHCNFWLAFWEKWWSHKSILNLTDLKHDKVIPYQLCNFSLTFSIDLSHLFLFLIFGLFSNPLTLYHYTVYGCFLLVIHFRQFLESHQIHYLGFIVMIVSDLDCFSWNLKIKRKIVVKFHIGLVEIIEKLPFINGYFSMLHWFLKKVCII